MKKFELPIIGFFDFEARMVEPEKTCFTCTDVSTCTHSVRIEKVQEAVTFSLLLLNFEGKIMHRKTYSSNECAKAFIQELLSLEPTLQEYLSQKKPLVLSAEERRKAMQHPLCHICEKPFLLDDVRHMDHCHIRGTFLGPSHATCNMERRVVKKIPLFCHNLTSYDGRLIARALDFPEITHLKALPRNTEKFRCIEMNSYIFLDSLSFLNGSLADVTDALVKSKHDFQLLDKIGLVSASDFAGKELLLRKGIFCYEFVTDVEQMRQTVELPAHEEFYSHLNNGNVTEEEYAHARAVYSHFKCSNLLDYCELYCELDVILLAECFLSFRKEVMDEFGLDPCQYISLPQLCFDCMLRKTGASIELLTDMDMITTLESGIRGGVSFIGTRHVEEEASSCHLYWDQNNLYG
jgi:hypothetical protein